VYVLFWTLTEALSTTISLCGASKGPAFAWGPHGTCICMGLPRGLHLHVASKGPAFAWGCSQPDKHM